MAGSANRSSTELLFGATTLVLVATRRALVRVVLAVGIGLLMGTVFPAALGC